MTPASRSSLGSIPTIQQEIARLVEMPSVQRATGWFRDAGTQYVSWQLELAQIAAPPFGEDARADWVMRRFHALGLQDVAKDGIGNAIGLKAGIEGSAISISAHLDTVFPPSTPLNIRQQGARLYGPGVSDNGSGVIALLAVAEAFVKFDIPHAAPLLFIGNVGEEGEGDLRGMRYVFTASRWKDAIRTSVVVDGAGCDTIVAEALGSRRFEIEIRGPGGHSWSDFGAPNPILALGRAIHLFSQTRVAASPKTTFNIGVIRGGTSVNSIPESASMRVDIRSTSAFEIERLEAELRRSIQSGIEEEGARSRAARNSSEPSGTLEADITLIGNRPGGKLDPNAHILQIVRAVDVQLGNTAQIQPASTDANIPISMGKEAVAIGAGGSGGGAHTLQEWFDAGGRELGLQRILLLVLALAGAR